MLISRKYGPFSSINGNFLFLITLQTVLFAYNPNDNINLSTNNKAQNYYFLSNIQHILQAFFMIGIHHISRFKHTLLMGSICK